MSHGKGQGSDQVLEDGEWFSYLRQELLDAANEGNHGHRFKISMVSPMFRREDPAAFEPITVSIGPYHHGKDALRPMEQMKRRFLAKFLDSTPNYPLEHHLDMMMEREAYFRSFYSEPVDMDSRQFVLMLLIDGCFLAQLLLDYDYFCRQGELVHPLVDLIMTRWNLFSIRQDLLLLENQIPFCILKELYSMVEVQAPLQTAIRKFFQDVLETLIPSQRQGNDVVSDVSLNVSPFHLLHFVHLWVLPPEGHCRPLEYHLHKRIATATMLHEAGIKFKRSMQLSPFQASFRNGVIELPLLNVSDGTVIILKNLIAFEQSTRASGLHVTNYMMLLDALVDNHADVAVLQKGGVISNMLGSDNEIADMLNKHGKGALVDSNYGQLAPFTEEVDMYYNSSWPK